MILLRFAEVRFSFRRASLEKQTVSSRGSRVDDPAAYQAEGILYVTLNARFDHLLSLPEGEAVGKDVNEAMHEIEKHNLQLTGDWLPLGDYSGVTPAVPGRHDSIQRSALVLVDVRVLCLYPSDLGMPRKAKKPDALQGTLDLLVLKTLSREPQHGYGIAARIQQITADTLRVEEGSLYPALHRMEQAGWISARWEITATNRRARLYRLTSAGRKRLTEQEQKWDQLAEAVAKVLRFA